MMLSLTPQSNQFTSSTDRIGSGYPQCDELGQPNKWACMDADYSTSICTLSSP